MRLRDLQLIRFGHFSDVRLDFAAGSSRFHVIYGDNEAGKSTALRAISGLLFGIPERTPDAHLHAPRDLRVGAELENDAGGRLAIVRRKGRRDTLLSADGSPIPESLLQPYVGGVPRELFATMFGLDHPRLVKGGRDLLEGHGELGEALFGAAAGLRGLHELVKALQREADDIFNPRAQKPSLNQALAAHAEARRQINQLALKPSEWETARRARDEASDGLERIRREHAGAKARLERRRVLQSALPDLRARSALLTRRDEIGHVAILPEDAGERRRRAEATLRTAGLRSEKLDDEKCRLESDLVRLDVPEDLLALEPRTADLGDRRAVYVKAARDRQDLLSKLDAGSVEVEALVRALPEPKPLDEIEGLRIDTARQARVRELVREGEGLQARVRALRENAHVAARRLQQAETGLAALTPERDAAPLRSVVGAARREGDLEGRQREFESEISRVETLVGQGVGALPFWKGSAEEVIALPLPSGETLDRFESELDRVGDERRALDERRRKSREGLDGLREKLTQLRSSGGIPTPDDLRDSRERRNGLWSSVRRVWLEGFGDARSPDALAGAYEVAVAETDALGDRIYSEHERVARIATLEDLERRAEEEASATEREDEELGRRQGHLAESWAEVWAPTGVQPASPLEMRAWKAQHESVVNRVGELGKLRAEEETLSRSVAMHRKACLDSLAILHGPELSASAVLAAILEAAEGVIQTVERSREERRQRGAAVAAGKEDVERFAAALSDAERDLGEWRQSWGAAIAPTHLPESAQPSEAEAVLDRLDEVFSKHAQLEALRERIRHIEEDGETFVSALDELVRDGCSNLAALAPADRAAELLARVQAGRENHTRQGSIRSRLTDIEVELADVGRERAAAESEIESLMNRAGLSSVERLEAAERASDEKRALDSRLRDVEERLRRSGIPLEDLVAEGDGLEEQELILEIDQLTQSVEAAEQQRDDQNQKLAGLQHEFDAMDGGAAAAEASGEAEQALARVARLAAEYAQKRMAAVLLGREIQRFAEANQGPILTGTSDLFRRMTLGRYRGITSGFSKDDQAILLCRRRDGETVGVEDLSDGTRDQLYMGLRLAALGHHMVHNESMPLIVDDVLVTFDDPRSAATLQIMGELAGETQVLFFTHHRRLVELAREVIPVDRLAVHELEVA